MRCNRQAFHRTTSGLLTASSLLRANMMQPLMHAQRPASHEASMLTSAAFCARRFQASDAVVNDKKFHCSVCKKPFRLERAAQVHLAQAHAGVGSVEAGPGPGYVADTPRMAVPTNAPPSAPTPRAATQTEFHAEDEDDRKFRNRVAPKPLHQPTVDVPSLAMDEMLAVWDKIGVARLEGFVHSSMVMRVFAMPQGSANTGYNIEVPTTGENPFAQLKDLKSAPKEAKKTETTTDDDHLPPFDLSKPFAPAPEIEASPFCTAAVVNPFLKPGSTLKAPAEKKPAVKPEAPQVPVTPYGQLPVFGTAIECKPKVDLPASPGTVEASTSATADAESPAAVASPFAGVASPFAGAVASPFAGAVASPFAGAVASPFASTVASPFAASAAASPFADAGPSSPFTSQSGGASPFAAPIGTASPFATSDASPFASPFAAGGASMSPFGVQATPSSAVPEASASPTHQNPVAASEEEKKMVCTTCGKAFRSPFDLASHMRDKHNIVTSDAALKPQKPKKRVLPDLPAFVPSPVDLAATSPFGASQGVSISWAEANLTVHGCAASNITIVGQVTDISPCAADDTVAMSVLVAAEKSGDADEIFTVKCFGPLKAVVTTNIKRRQFVLVSGTLRLLPHQEGLNKYFWTPVVHVAPSAGSVVVVE